jgi:DNA-directed RNA polymerase sigma subunit (sigma70/sigma32)
MLNRSGLRFDDYAMTFDEIGKRLGISRQAAQQSFCCAVRKLRRQRPHSLALLRALGAELQRERGRRQFIKE